MEIDEKKLSRISLWTTLIVDIMVFTLAFHPPEFIVWLNLFALGGLVFIIGSYLEKSSPEEHLEIFFG